MFNAIFCKITGAKYDNTGSGQVHMWAFRSLWVLIGRMPDGDFTVRIASPMAGGILVWAKAQMSAAMAHWVAAASTAGLIARSKQLEEQILLVYEAAEAGAWTYTRARAYETELDAQIRSIEGELHLRDSLSLQQA